MKLGLRRHTEWTDVNMSTKTAAQRLAAQRAEQKAKRESSLQEKLARSAAEEAAKAKKKTKKAAETEAVLTEIPVENVEKHNEIQQNIRKENTPAHSQGLEKEPSVVEKSCGIASTDTLKAASSVAEMEKDLHAARAIAAASEVALTENLALLATKDSIVASAEARAEHEAKLRVEAEAERQAAEAALLEASKSQDVGDCSNGTEVEAATQQEDVELCKAALREKFSSTVAEAAVAQQSFEEREKTLQEQLKIASDARAEALKSVESQAVEIKTAHEAREDIVESKRALQGDLERALALQNEMHLATVGLRNEIDELRVFTAAEREVWQQQSIEEERNDALQKSLKEQLEMTVAQVKEQKATIDEQRNHIEEKKAEVEELRSELDLCMVSLVPESM